MRLTQENVNLYEGKTLDAKSRLHHCYPLQVKKNKLGELMCVDRIGTYMPIPEERGSCCEIYFDFIIGESKY